MLPDGTRQPEHKKCLRRGFMNLVAATLLSLGHVNSRVLVECGLTSKSFFTDGYHRYLEGQLGCDCVQGTSLLRSLCPVTDSLNRNVYANKNQVPWSESKGMLIQEGWSLSTTQQKARCQKLEMQHSKLQEERKAVFLTTLKTPILTLDSFPWQGTKNIFLAPNTAYIAKGHSFSFIYFLILTIIMVLSL